MESVLGRSTPGPRGQTSPIGVVLILGIVLMGTTIAVAAAASVIGDSQRQLDADRAEQALTQLDSKVAMVALGNSRTQRATLSGMQGGAYNVEPDAGWMNVTINDTAAGTTETMFNTSMGAVTFENDERSVAYQGGGVWRGEQNGSFMVSPPEFYYRDATLTLPLVTVSGDHSLTQDVSIERNGSSVQHYPNASESWRNPLEHGVVDVTVQSEYYQAWGSFWETRTDGSVVYDHDRDRVSLTLVVPAGNRQVTSAVSGTSSSGDLILSGSGGSPTRTDSYNSTQGSYSATKTDNGTIVAAGTVDMSGNSRVNGSVRSGGAVEVHGSAEVEYDVEHSDGFSGHASNVGGDISQISGVQGDAPIDTYVSRRYDAIADDNNNSDTGVPISGDTLDSGSPTLDPGRYHLNEIDLSGETLTLNTGSGETIELAVRDSIRLSDGHIEVQGTGQVRVYVDGNPAGEEFLIPNNDEGTVDVLNDENASQFWLYGKSDFEAHIDGTSNTDPRFEGVIYAPGGHSGTSSFTMEKAELFGSVVVGDVTLDNGGSVHFDQALLEERAVPPDESIVRVTYMHVSHTRVNLTD